MLLPDRRLQRQVWRQVGNPGVLLRQGKIAGIWKSKTLRGKLQLNLTFWQAPSDADRAAALQQAEAYAAFRLMGLGSCTITALC